jgi:hypothetical protein
MDLVKELGDYLKDMASDATLRNGDYPRERGALDVTVILSELKDVEKVRKYYTKSAVLIEEVKKRREEAKSRLKGIDDASKDIPSLL